MTVVLCCPVEGKLWPATAASLAAYAPSAEIIPIPADDITRPWADYAARWGKDDLVVVEQDVVIHEDVLPGFDRCPEPWCLYPGRHYARGGDFMDSGILCNRFRKSFMERVSVSDVEAIPGSCGDCKGVNRKCFRHLDGRTREAGEAAGYRLHIHWPSVGHRTEGKPGEWPDGEPWTEPKP